MPCCCCCGTTVKAEAEVENHGGGCGGHRVQRNKAHQEANKQTKEMKEKQPDDSIEQNYGK